MMPSPLSTRFRFAALPATLCALLLLAGCSNFQMQRAQWLINHDRAAEGIAKLQVLAAESPRPRFRMAYVAARDKEIERLLATAQTQMAGGHETSAEASYRAVLALLPDDERARAGLADIDKNRRNSALLKQANERVSAGQPQNALNLLNQVLAQSPDHAGALTLKQTLERERSQGQTWEPALVEALQKPVTLEFRNATLGAVLDVLSRASGLNLILDKNLQMDTRITIFARNTSVADALALVMKSANVQRKVMNENTLLIYPASEEKVRQYQELVVRNFYLGTADPRKIQELVRSILGAKTMHVNEDARILTVRDTPDMLDAIERLLVSHDGNEPEVVLDVEILEISSDKLLNLGVEYPDSASASVVNAAGVAGGPFALKDVDDINSSNVRVTFPDPAAILNLRKTDGDADILAKPRIRVKNRTKAKVVIGDKVPVITITTNQTSGSTQESVSYLDVGLTLEVTPEVHVNQEVSVDLSLEVSNIVKEVKSATGLLTYQIGTRSAKTALRVRDGETQALAGLIRDEKRNSASRVPLLGSIPVLGKFFSNESNSHAKSEIVLLMTPHIVRPYRMPDAEQVAFASGTGDTITTRPLRLTKGGDYSSTRSALSSAPAVPAEAAAEAAVEDNAAIAEDSGLADLRLELVGPAQINRGSEFTVTLMAHGNAWKSLGMQLKLDGGAQLLRARSPQPGVEIEQQPAGDGVALNFPPAAENSSGVLALLTLRAPDTGGVPLTLRMNKVEARARDGTTPLLVAPAAPRQILVTP